MLKRCCSCKLDLPYELFSSNKSSRDGLQSQCKACQRKQAAKYRQNNLQKERERCARVAREWRKRHPERARASSRNSDRRPERRVSKKLQKILHGMKSGVSWTKIVGYSAKELRDHLERQFLPGMSWENYGKWHVDHIVPLSAYQISGRDCPNMKRAWCLTNLRPLWAKENQVKSDKREFLL
jgi:hypothetical protein